MVTSSLNDRLQILASLAVLIGLIFVALEIRQSNHIAIATTEISVRDAYGSSNETVYSNPEFAALLAKARDSEAKFSDAEQEMLEYWLARMLNIWISSEKAYNNEMISKETFDLAMDDMKWTIDTYPSLRPSLQTWSDDYPTSAKTELGREMMRYLGEK